MSSSQRSQTPEESYCQKSLPTTRQITSDAEVLEGLGFKLIMINVSDEIQGVLPI